MNNVLFGDETFGYYETVCGGSGAGDGFAGTDAVHTHMTNTRITDPEILEHRYPVRSSASRSAAAPAGRGGIPAGRERCESTCLLVRVRCPCSRSIARQDRTAWPAAAQAPRRAASDPGRRAPRGSEVGRRGGRGGGRSPGLAHAGGWGVGPLEHLSPPASRRTRLRRAPVPYHDDQRVTARPRGPVASGTQRKVTTMLVKEQASAKKGMSIVDEFMAEVRRAIRTRRSSFRPSRRSSPRWRR